MTEVESDKTEEFFLDGKEPVKEEEITQIEEVQDSFEELENLQHQLAAETFHTLNELIESGYKFSDAQMDTGIRLSLSRIPETRQRWFKHICDSIAKRPFWQVLWGQFNRNHDNSVAQNPLLDPTWKPGHEKDMENSTCVICEESFMPITYGQRVCGNKCGAELNRRDREKAGKESRARVGPH